MAEVKADELLEEEEEVEDDIPLTKPLWSVINVTKLAIFSMNVPQ
jgi:hypothetical protein